MNIFKKVRQTKYKAMALSEKAKRYVGPDEEDVKAYQEYKKSVLERKKIKQDLYKEKEQITREKSYMRKRSASYRIADAIKKSVQDKQKRSIKGKVLPKGSPFKEGLIGQQNKSIFDR